MALTNDEKKRLRNTLEGLTAELDAYTRTIPDPDLDAASRDAEAINAGHVPDVSMPVPVDAPPMPPKLRGDLTSFAQNLSYEGPDVVELRRKAQRATTREELDELCQHLATVYQWLRPSDGESLPASGSALRQLRAPGGRYRAASELGTSLTRCVEAISHPSVCTPRARVGQPLAAPPCGLLAPSYGLRGGTTGRASAGRCDATTGQQRGSVRAVPNGVGGSGGCGECKRGWVLAHREVPDKNIRIRAT